jgi:hypothetical protein
MRTTGTPPVQASNATQAQQAEQIQTGWPGRRPSGRVEGNSVEPIGTQLMGSICACQELYHWRWEGHTD